MTAMSNNRRRFRFAAGILGLSAVMVLSACGGGGGEGEENPPQTTGLVPEAPPLGATLAPQAASLQPLAPGATWTYTGAYFGTPGFSMEYSNVVSHTAAPRGVIEAATDAFALGPTEIALGIVGGNVVQTSQVDFDGDGKVDAIDPIVLRSPVRQNDQIVHTDSRMLTNSDSDGDGLKDSLDFAIYSRVIGTETVELGGSLGNVSAVRVDLVTVGRMVLTAGAIWPTYTTTLSTWYAPSLGAVRRRLDQGAPPNQFAPYSDELLDSVTGL
ncbi:MAG: dockerin type I domain-containing protein [Pseudomonadota bacterium]